MTNVDLVGVEQGHRWKLGQSVVMTWRFRDATGTAINVTGRTYTMGLWDVTGNAGSLTFTPDVTDAVNGNVVMSLLDTSTLTVGNVYKIEAWEENGLVKTLLYEGHVTVELAYLAP